MEKVKEAKVKIEAADELDTIKLAVVEAVAHSTDGYVSGPNLADALDGIISSDQIPTIRANVNGPTWLVTGSKGKYEISRNGQVEALSGIELSQTAITFTEGATNADVQLTATLTVDLMGSTITWSSNNTNVATVDANGKVSVATNMQEDNKNTAIITAEIAGTTNVAKCTVTFVETQIHSLEVTVTPSTIVIGKTTGTATTRGKGILGKDFGEITEGVTYSSNDTGVATVSGTTINGVSEDEVIITATATVPGANSVLQEKTGTCIVNVEESKIPEVGDFIDLGIDLDNSDDTTDDWKVLCVDSTNNTIYAITNKLLLTEKMPASSHITKSGDYAVCGKNESGVTDYVRNYLSDYNNWSELVNIGTYGETVKVYGAFTISGESNNTWNHIKNINKLAIYHIPENKDKAFYWTLETQYGTQFYRIYTNDGKLGNSKDPYNVSDAGICPIAVVSSQLNFVKNEIEGRKVWQIEN